MTSGTYGGGTFGSLWGIGGGLYIDSHGRIYPQAYGGTPGVSLSAGYTPDLEGLLTGTSVAGSVGSGSFRYNLGTSGSATGVGFGTPGVGVTYGVGPLEMAQDYSRPWATPAIRDSTAAAGIPSRYNVWEYDYPSLASTSAKSAPNAKPDGRGRLAGQAISPDSLSSMGGIASRTAALAGANPPPPTRKASLPQMALGRVSVNQPSPSVVGAGASPIADIPSAPQNAPRGLPGMMIDAGYIDPTNPDPPPAGGLAGLIQDYLRYNGGANR